MYIIYIHGTHHCSLCSSSCAFSMQRKCLIGWFVVFFRKEPASILYFALKPYTKLGSGFVLIPGTRFPQIPSRIIIITTYKEAQVQIFGILACLKMNGSTIHVLMSGQFKVRSLLIISVHCFTLVLNVAQRGEKLLSFMQSESRMQAKYHINNLQAFSGVGWRDKAFFFFLFLKKNLYIPKMKSDCIIRPSVWQRTNKLHSAIGWNPKGPFC